MATATPYLKAITWPRNSEVAEALKMLEEMERPPLPVFQADGCKVRRVGWVYGDEIREWT